jgi:hypothetical protein
MQCFQGVMLNLELPWNFAPQTQCRTENRLSFFKQHYFSVCRQVEVTSTEEYGSTLLKVYQNHSKQEHRTEWLLSKTLSDDTQILPKRSMFLEFSGKRINVQIKPARSRLSKKLFSCILRMKYHNLVSTNNNSTTWSNAFGGADRKMLFEKRV